MLQILRNFEAFVAYAGSLPLPGRGATLDRWRDFARLAAQDLNLVKLAESHADALAILAECRAPAAKPRSRWAVWSSELPSAQVSAQRRNEFYVLNGLKAWCAGAPWVTDALVTCRDNEAQPLLVHVHMDQHGVHVDDEPWQGLGLRECGTRNVHFSNATGVAVGSPGDYLVRPGYWHAAIGVAACWHGAAVAVANRLRKRCERQADPHTRAHLGAVDVLLSAAAAALRDAAFIIDTEPTRRQQALALRVRGIVELAAANTIDRVGRALGAAPLCLDAEHAQRIADLMLFLRQSHAERDLEQLSAYSARDHDAWNL